MKIQLNNETAQKVIDDKFGINRYKLISEYKGRKSKIILEDLQTGQISTIPSFDRILDKRLKTLKNYFEMKDKKSVYQQKLDNNCGYHHFDVLEYHGLNGNRGACSKFKCLKCGAIFERRAGDIIKYKSCPVCENKSPKLLSIKDVSNEINKIDIHYHVLSTEYKGTHSPLLIHHDICGKDYYGSRTNFLGGRRCPHCIESHNEKEIAQILKDMNILFEQQKRFQYREVSNKPFDFYLPEYNTAIEYDGELHYHPVHGENALKIQQNNDNIKTAFCKDHGIRLIRIPYWEKENISEIIHKIKQ